MSYIIPDPRLEMPELLAPRRKPSGKTIIDQSLPIARKLSSFFCPSPGSVHDFVTEQMPISLIGNWEVKADGIGWRLDADADEIVFADHPGNRVENTDFTLWWRGYMYGEVAGFATFLAKREGTRGNGDWWLYTRGDASNDEIVFDYQDNGTGGLFATLGGSSWPAVHPEIYDIYLTQTNSGTFKLYQYHAENLNQGSTTDTGPFPLTTAQSSLYEISNRDNDHANDAVVMCCAIWHRKLEDQEVYSLHRDPYQFLIPA